MGAAPNCCAAFSTYINVVSDMDHYADTMLFVLISDGVKQPQPIRERADAVCLDETSTPDVPGWQ